MTTNRDISGRLALLATEVDSLAKSLARAETELERERGRRRELDVELHGLREELAICRQRAKKAEGELARFAVRTDRERHAAEMLEQELRQQLAASAQSSERLRESLEQKEGECRALEQNLRELMENLRNAAIEAGRATTGPGHEASGA
jgi:chromosome segregation ATPase